MAPRTLIVPDEYPTIQSAVDNATAGDTVFVRNGTYFENVAISKALTVSGENYLSTIVDGRNSSSVFTVSARSVNIVGFTIRNGGGLYPNSGIRVLSSSLCVFKDNILTGSYVGVLLTSSYGNLLEGNQILVSHYGVYSTNSPSNRMVGNSFTDNYAGITMYSSSDCQIVANTVANNTVGVSTGSSGNIFYHNNFIRNSVQVLINPDNYTNTWDNGYPSGGNYWSNYFGLDLYKGPSQNVSGSDGIGDTPHVMNGVNVDRFPFVQPVLVSHDVAVLSVVPSAFRVYQGQTVNISVVVANLGNYTESFSLSLYGIKGSNETLVGTKSVANLAIGAETTLIFEWGTSPVAQGNYTIRAQASRVEGERNLTNNILSDGTIAIVERSHDVAVLSVVPSAFRVYQGQTVNITVVVANLGNFTETFNVTAYYDESVIGKQIVANLGASSELTIVYGWNTTSVEPNREYSIRAEASAVANETNLADNVLVDGSVKVKFLALGAIKVVELVPSDHLGNPSSNFYKGAISYFKVVVNNTSVDSEIVLVAVNAYDSSSASLGVVSFKGLIMPGVSIFILGLPVPSTAHTGTARVYANTLTDWIFAGGLPYGPEMSATFQILG